MPNNKLFFYIHDIINALVTIAIFAMLFMIAAKVFKNIGSLLNIITL